MNFFKTIFLIASLSNIFFLHGMQKKSLTNKDKNKSWYNASMQGLFGCKHFCTFFLHASEICENPLSIKIKKLYALLNKDDLEKVVEDNTLYPWVIKNYFDNNQKQYDPGEFVSKFFDSLQDIEIKSPFSYTEKSQFSCIHCSQESSLKKIEYILMLEIPKKAKSLDECLNHYFKKEIVTKHCSSCDSAEAVKQISITNNPAILVIHLKSVDKNTKNISIPNTIDINNITYKFRSMILHSDTIDRDSIALVRTKKKYCLFSAEERVWIYNDDLKRSLRNYDRAESFLPYILLYETKEIKKLKNNTIDEEGDKKKNNKRDSFNIL